MDFLRCLLRRLKTSFACLFELFGRCPVLGSICTVFCLSTPSFPSRSYFLRSSGSDKTCPSEQENVFPSLVDGTEPEKQSIEALKACK